jgi:hypothetical protein
MLVHLKIDTFVPMKVLISLLCLSIWPALSMAQQNEKLSFYGEISYNRVLNTDMPAIKHMPHEVYNYNVLDGSLFTEDEKNKPLYYRLPLSLKIGAALTSEKKNLVTIGFSYNHFARTDTLGSKLRYADMVNERAGFVNPSYYQLVSGYHIYRTIGLDVDYLFADAIGSYQQRFGFGLGVQRLLGSSYFLNHIDSRNGEKSDFSAQNLTLQDKIWIFNPSVSYQGKVHGGDKYDFWLVASARVNVQEKYKVEPLGNLLSVGLRVELK